MCDTANGHNTGWEVIRIQNTTEVRYAGRWDMYGTRYNVCKLYLRCRTQDCIETKIKTVDGHWTLKDFKG